MIPIKIYEYNNIKYTDPNEFRKVFKNVSFPKNITDQMLMARGVIVKDETELETLEDKKNKKLAYLNEKYQEVVNGTVSVKLTDELTIKMLFAEKDLLMVRAMLDRMTDASLDNGVLVDVDDNVYMNLSKDTVDKVYHAMLDKQFSIYMQLKQYQIGINGANSEEELNAIQISF